MGGAAVIPMAPVAVPAPLVRMGVVVADDLDDADADGPARIASPRSDHDDDLFGDVGDEATRAQWIGVSAKR
jgi:hypothetical protein